MRGLQPATSSACTRSTLSFQTVRESILPSPPIYWTTSWSLCLWAKTTFRIYWASWLLRVAPVYGLGLTICACYWRLPEVENSSAPRHCLLYPLHPATMPAPIWTTRSRPLLHPYPCCKIKWQTAVGQRTPPLQCTPSQSGGRGNRTEQGRREVTKLPCLGAGIGFPMRSQLHVITAYYEQYRSYSKCSNMIFFFFWMERLLKETEQKK